MATHLAGAELGSTFSVCGADARRIYKVVCDSREIFEGYMGYVSFMDGICFLLRSLYK